jgi:hypothetical protein
MRNLRSAAVFGAAFLVSTSVYGRFQSAANTGQRVLFVSGADSGRRLTATVGQQIEVTLATIGPGQFGLPVVSSPAVHFENVALRLPANPGGPTQTYIFRAANPGEAALEIRHTDQERNFTLVIQVRGTQQTVSAPVDQANDALWTNAWTNLVNNVRQTFTPSLSKVTEVEVELVAANPDEPSEEITLMLLGPQDEILAEVAKVVSVSDCAHVSFVLPNGGLQVLTGKVYSMRLSGGTLFGWKYVEGGYKKGSATFNGKPLLANRRSTFLFRTYGGD